MASVFRRRKAAMSRKAKTSGYSGFENKLQHIGAIHDELTGPLYLNARYYISPSNELCELQTDLCKKRPNLRFGCVLLPSRGREGSSLGTATEEKGRMQIRGIYMRTAPITRSTVDPSGHKFFSVYKYKNQKRYKLTMKLNWNDVQDALYCSKCNFGIYCVCVGRLPAGMISAAAGTALLTIGVATAVTSLIMDKYLKNHALTVRIWFSYKYKQKTTRVRRQGRRYKITRKWVKIYNIKKEAKLRG